MVSSLRRGAKEDDDRVLEPARTVLSRPGREKADDPSVLTEAERYTQRWLKDPTSVSGEVAEIAVPIASMHAGALRLDELRAAAKSAKAPKNRVLAIRAMGKFDDPALLRKAFDLATSGKLKLSRT